MSVRHYAKAAASQQEVGLELGRQGGTRVAERMSLNHRGKGRGKKREGAKRKENSQARTKKVAFYHLFIWNAKARGGIQRTTRSCSSSTSPSSFSSPHLICMERTAGSLWRLRLRRAARGPNSRFILPRVGEHVRAPRTRNPSPALERAKFHWVHAPYVNVGGVPHTDAERCETKLFLISWTRTPPPLPPIEIPPQLQLMLCQSQIF